MPRQLTVVAPALLASLWLLSACPPPGDTTPVAPRPSSVRLRSFTESAPVRLVLPAGPHVFSAAAHGLDRWSIDGSGAVEHLPLSAAHGLPGDRVQALTYDRGRNWLWVATDGGITIYDVAAATFTELPPAPQVLGLGDLAGVVLAPASDGGVWIGSALGLFYTNGGGRWTNTAITEPVTALHLATDGWLWIGTEHGVIGRQPTGDTFRYGPEEGCVIEIIRVIERAPGGGALFVGEDHAGAQRVSTMIDGACASYRVAPDARWDGVAARNDDAVVVLSGGKLYEMKLRVEGARALRRDGLRLIPVAAAAARSPYAVVELDLRLPSVPQVLAAAAGEIYVATRDLGIQRLGLGRKASIWLRRSDLVANASALTVACAGKDDCYVAMGTTQAWRFDGDRFAPTGPGTVAVLATMKNPTDGAVYALFRREDGRALQVARISGGIWKNEDVVIKTRGNDPHVSFARFSPSGVLWLGLRYRDQVGEVAPWGVAQVDLSLGVVAYHHASRDRREARKGVLPIPIDVVDAAFLGADEVWLATSEGAARVRGSDVEVFGEARGLDSELIRAVACSRIGLVFIGSKAGVITFDGSRWMRPPGLSQPVNDLVLDPAGRLWLATQRGVTVFDGKKVKRVNVRRGLLDNQVDEVVLDDLGRIWARSKGGLTIISP